jgi:carboxyl-terminal processing protease
MLATLALLFAAQAAPPAALPDIKDQVEAIRKFVAVYAALSDEAAEPVDPNPSIYGGALPGMLRGLDPHSVFLDPDQMQQLKEMNSSERKGFGSVVSILPGRVFVLQTLPGTPSAKSGLSPGDEIVAVNNISLMGLEPEQLIQLLSETRRREAQIYVRRLNTPRLLTFQLVPENLAAPSVDRAFLLPAGPGYIRVANFDSKTGQELKAAIEKLGGAALPGLVLDLRNNPGGSVETALEACSLFLKPGTKLLSIRGRSKKEEEVHAPDGGTPYEFPLTVLINEKTASAAEILGSALRDHMRAILLGNRSFGKGLVQSVYPLSGGSGIALTVAYYYSPAGANLQRPLKNVQIETPDSPGGIAPDETVFPDAQNRLRAVLDMSGSFTAFATELVRKGLPQGPMPSGVYDDFRIWLSERQIQPSVSDWSANGEWLRSRLQQEVLNLTQGVEKGDEIELARDPVVRRAVERLKPPAPPTPPAKPPNN